MKTNIINKFYDFIKIKNIFYFLNSIYIPIIFLSLFLFLSAIYLGLYINTNDFQQGEYYKIIYIHVPSAWISITLYVFLAIFSFIYLINKYLFINLLANIFGILGINFTLITLITGSLWGKLSWGSYWVWDARLTSVLILFFLYLGYLIIALNHSNDIKYKYYSSLLAIIGFINIPIIKYSVEWWNTLHQSSSVSQISLSIDYSIFIPLMLIYLALLLFIITIINIYLLIY
jgi:heme exporter protein C